MKLRYLLIGVLIFAVMAVAVFSFLHKPREMPIVIQTPKENTVNAASGAAAATSTTPLPLTQGENTFLYAEVIDSCGPYYVGTCVNVRSGPGTKYPVALKLRDGVVLKVIASVMSDGKMWYKLDPGSNIQFPERVTSDWYVQADLVKVYYHTGDEMLTGVASTTSKRIVVSIRKQQLTAYDGQTIFMQEAVSTGLPSTPTPLGTFRIFRKTPSRYMQGPVPGVSDQYYDLPGVPWDMYFTQEGGAIHGTYWHTHFGQVWSHGCVNLPLDSARTLYEWAPLGTPVYVIP